MQVAAARVAARVARSSRLPSVLRGVAFATGLAARAATRAVESYARLEVLLYVTGEITLADILVYTTTTFEDVDAPEPEPLGPPHMDERVAAAVFSGMALIAGAFVVLSVADAVAERSRTRKQQQKTRCHPNYELVGPQRYSSTSSSLSHGEAPAPATAAPLPCWAITEASPTSPHRDVAPFDASRAIAAWLHSTRV